MNHDDPSGTDPLVWCEMAEKTFDYADTEYVGGRPRRVYHYTQYFDCHVVGGVLPVSAPGGTLTKNPNHLPHSAEEPPAPSCTVQKVLIAGAFGADVVQGVSLLDGMGEILGGLRLLGEGTLPQVGRAAVGGIAVRTVGGFALVQESAAGFAAANLEQAQVGRGMISVGSTRFAADATAVQFGPAAHPGPPSSLADLTLTKQAIELYRSCRAGG